MKLSARMAVAPAAVLMAVAAAPASAETLGQVAPAGAQAITCPTTCEVGQLTTEAGGAVDVVPPGGGVITSWTFRALSPGTAYLILTRYQSPDLFVVAQSPARKFSPGELETTPVRIPVSGGEHIGVGVNGPPPVFAYGSSANEVKLVGKPVPVGRPPDSGGGGRDPLPAGPGQPTGGFLVNMAVTLEPDADHDGYGDVTQAPSGSGAGGVSSSSPTNVAGVPHIRLTASKRESIRHGFVTLVLASDSDVTASASGLVKQRGVHKRYRLRSIGESVRANSPATLKLKLTSKQLKSIRQRLRDHRKAVATITVTVHNAAGATSAASLKIYLGR